MVSISFDLSSGHVMAHISYYRVSTLDQSIESQRRSLLDNVGIAKFDRDFMDEGVSGSTSARDRPGLAALLSYVRDSDTVYVYALDRLGRDAIDVQQTVRALTEKGARLHIHGIGVIGGGVGELIVAVLAQMAQMERHRIIERCESGRAAARTSLSLTGLTHRGKERLGRPPAANPSEVKGWRQSNKASISRTASHFSISSSTVIRYCKQIDTPSSPM